MISIWWLPNNWYTCFQVAILVVSSLYVYHTSCNSCCTKIMRLLFAVFYFCVVFNVVIFCHFFFLWIFGILSITIGLETCSCGDLTNYTVLDQKMMELNGKGNKKDVFCFFVLIIGLKWIVKPKAPEKCTATQMQHENIAKAAKEFLYNHHVWLC